MMNILQCKNLTVFIMNSDIYRFSLICIHAKGSMRRLILTLHAKYFIFSSITTASQVWPSMLIFFNHGWTERFFLRAWPEINGIYGWDRWQAFISPYVICQQRSCWVLRLHPWSSSWYLWRTAESFDLGIVPFDNEDKSRCFSLYTVQTIFRNWSNFLV